VTVDWRLIVSVAIGLSIAAGLVLAVEECWYHAMHHGSDAFTVATAYRVSFINQFVAPIFYLPCLLAGFNPLLIVTLQLLNVHYQAWVHTELIGRLGIIDRIVNTPRIIACTTAPL
jgi:sterol desaturase/sphingolipid hydroxylase (fatty acid hydroxylase superfamily)